MEKKLYVSLFFLAISGEEVWEGLFKSRISCFSRASNGSPLFFSFLLLFLPSFPKVTPKEKGELLLVEQGSERTPLPKKI